MVEFFLTLAFCVQHLLVAIALSLKATEITFYEVFIQKCNQFGLCGFYEP